MQSRRSVWNPQVYEYVCRRKTALEKLNYYEWAKYLEKINTAETTLNLLTKLDESAKRSNLDVYRQILFDEFESKECFYCGKRLHHEGIQVDHFIPWAFIKDDKLWIWFWLVRLATTKNVINSHRSHFLINLYSETMT